MTNADKKEFKVLIKEGTIEALKSSEGQDAIAEALITEKAKDVILDVFVEAFHEVVVPAFENQNKRIQRLEKTMGGVM